MKWPLVCLESIPSLEPYLGERRGKPGNYPAQMAFAAILFERETYYKAFYNPHGLDGEEPPPAHNNAWHPFPVTAEALVMLRELRHWDGESTLVERAYDLFGMKAEALAGLQSVLRPRKAHLRGYLVAARFSRDLLRHEETLSYAQEAERLTPNHGTAVAYLYDATVYLSEKNPKYERVMLATERRVQQLFGERWMSKIETAKHNHEEELRREAWRVRARVEGEEFTRFIKSEREFCEEERERAMAVMDPAQVPGPLKELIPLARHYGVGDDPCRAYFVERTPKRDRSVSFGKSHDISTLLTIGSRPSMSRPSLQRSPPSFGCGKLSKRCVRRLREIGDSHEWHLVKLYWSPERAGQESPGRKLWVQ